MERMLASCCLLLLAVTSAAQQQSSTQGGPADLTSALAQLEQSAQTTSLDLAHLRIEKWKGEKSFKQDAQEKASSLEKNLTAALPEMISGVRNAPGTLAPALKLYRNMNVVYDVLASLTESAGAFGPKEEFRALATDTESIDSARRSLADALEAMAAAQDAELARARAQSRPATSEVKKIVVDDNQPAPKPARKKKPAKAPTPPPESAPKPQ